MDLAGVSATAVNPARAGMIRRIPHRRSLVHRKPRASGDDPALVMAALKGAL